MVILWEVSYPAVFLSASTHLCRVLHLSFLHSDSIVWSVNMILQGKKFSTTIIHALTYTYMIHACMHAYTDRCLHNYIHINVHMYVRMYMFEIATFPIVNLYSVFSLFISIAYITNIMLHDSNVCCIEIFLESCLYWPNFSNF